MVVETTFLFGRPIFRGYVSFSPGNPFMNRPWFDNRKDQWFFEDHFHPMPILNLSIFPTPEVMDRRYHRLFFSMLYKTTTLGVEIKWGPSNPASISQPKKQQICQHVIHLCFQDVTSLLSISFVSPPCYPLSLVKKKHRGMDDEVGLLIPQLWILGIASQQPPTIQTWLSGEFLKMTVVCFFSYV